MKAKHRHELKTNELADWLGHLPEWAAENRNWLIGGAAVIVALVAVYAWKVYMHDPALVQKRVDLTMAVSSVAQGKSQLITQQSSGADASYLLIQPAEKLGSFAEAETNPNLSAFAFIKQAETLRAEVQFRMTGVTSNTIKTQIDLARKAYSSALERKPTLPALQAAARYGLGLCDEEVGNFDSARNIYEQLVADPKFKGTPAVAAAEIRLQSMDDYREPISFRPSPIRPKPQVKITGADPNNISIDDISKFIKDTNSTPVKTPVDSNMVITITPPETDANSVEIESPTEAPAETTKPAETEATATETETTAAEADKPVEKPVDPNAR